MAHGTRRGHRPTHHAPHIASSLITYPTHALHPLPPPHLRWPVQDVVHAEPTRVALRECLELLAQKDGLLCVSETDTCGVWVEVQEGGAT